MGLLFYKSNTNHCSYAKNTHTGIKLVKLILYWPSKSIKVTMVPVNMPCKKTLATLIPGQIQQLQIHYNSLRTVIQHMYMLVEN